AGATRARATRARAASAAVRVAATCAGTCTGPDRTATGTAARFAGCRGVPCSAVAAGPRRGPRKWPGLGGRDTAYAGARSGLGCAGRVDREPGAAAPERRAGVTPLAT